MDKQYIFKVKERNLKTSNNPDRSIKLDYEILIQINEIGYDFPRCIMSITSSDNVKELKPLVDKIDFKCNTDFQKTLGQEEIEAAAIIGYLKGYFGFNSKEDIEDSKITLIDILNGKHPNRNYHSKTWNLFIDTFNKWYQDSLKPCLQQDIDLLIRYHKQI